MGVGVVRRQGWESAMLCTGWGCGEGGGVAVRERRCCVWMLRGWCVLGCSGRWRRGRPWISFCLSYVLWGGVRVRVCCGGGGRWG